VTEREPLALQHGVNS